MTRITIKTKVDPSAKKTTNTIGVWWDELKLKLSFTEKAIHSHVADDVEFGVERPGHFIIEHHPHKKVRALHIMQKGKPTISTSVTTSCITMHYVLQLMMTKP